tara:strand:+ start:7251 stop:7853 length:603 start_codon:yes stop_codon:yes gene_type:complete
MKFRYGNGDNSHLGGNLVSEPDDTNTMGDPATFATGIWDFLINEYNVKSVLDVGCGSGYSLDYFKSEHNCTVLGIEGLYENIIDMHEKGLQCIYHDLNDGPIKTVGFDLVNSFEVAEHIDEEFVENFLNTMIGNKMICMTAASPNQGGHHHVNCQPKEYWIDKMKVYGFEYEKDVTEHCKTLHDGHFRKNGLIFKNTKIT